MAIYLCSVLLVWRFAFATSVLACSELYLCQQEFVCVGQQEFVLPRLVFTWLRTSNISDTYDRALVKTLITHIQVRRFGFQCVDVRCSGADMVKGAVVQASDVE